MSFNLLDICLIHIFLSFISVAISFPMTRIIYQDEYKGYFVKIFLKRFLCSMAVITYVYFYFIYMFNISIRKSTNRFQCGINDNRKLRIFFLGGREE